MIKMFKKIAKKIRENILKLTYSANSSHVGSSLSIVDILVVVYLKFINFEKKNFNIFILSKGHACLALYCILYEKNKISKKTLESFGKNNSLLMSHASHKVPGVHFSTGSLGHGLPVAAGVALANKIKKTNKRVIVLLSDGELNEGSNWESLLFASHNNLNNLTIIIDYNKIQSLDFVKNTLKIEPLKKKLISFGCSVNEVDGHNYLKIFNSLKKIPKAKPLVIIAHTIKGKGVKFMENKVLWHYKSPNLKELNKALIGLR